MASVTVVIQLEGRRVDLNGEIPNEMGDEIITMVTHRLLQLDPTPPTQPGEVTPPAEEPEPEP